MTRHASPQHAATSLCSEKKGIKIISSKPAMHDVFSHCWESNCLQQGSISSAAHSRAGGEGCAHTVERNKPTATTEPLIHKMNRGASPPSYLFRSSMQHNPLCLQTLGWE